VCSSDLKFGTHFPAGEKGRGYTCPDVTYGKPCPVCRVRAKLAQLDDEEAHEIAKSIGVRIRYAIKAIERASPEDVLPVALPKTVYDEIFAAYRDDGDDLSNPTSGRDIRVSKTGQGLKTEYKTRILEESVLAESKEERATLVKKGEDINFEEILVIDEEGLKGIVEASVPTKFLKEIDYFEDEEDADEDEDEEEEEKDEESDDEEDEEEEESDDEDDEEEDDKPSKKGKKSKDEDDDEDDDDSLDDVELDDDEEDEKPSKKSKKNEDDEEEEEDDDEEDDEEEEAEEEDDEEEKPKSKKGKKDDDEIEIEIEVDDDDEPKKGKKSSEEKQPKRSVEKRGKKGKRVIKR
jgi:hypothetical protein